MEVNNLKKDTIERLKKVKKERELTVSEIINILDSKGYYLSEATIKRVFSDNADPQSFKYRDTIAPLADALLDLYADQSGANEVESLKSMIRDKNMTINILIAKNEEIRADFERRVAHLKKQIDNLEEHLNFRERVVDAKDRELSKKDEIIFKLLDKLITDSP